MMKRKQLLWLLVLITPVIFIGAATWWPVWTIEGAHGIIDLISTNGSIDFAATNPLGDKNWNLDIEVDTTWSDGRYLWKENTTPFTPDADHEPATKKYVDDSAGNVQDKIQDADGDTKVQTEAFPDEDYIRFDTAGIQAGYIDSNQVTWFGETHVGDFHASDIDVGEVDCGNITCNDIDGGVFTHDGPRCRAYLSTSQLDLTSGSWTKVDVDAETYDSDIFNTTTHRCTPTAAGYYLVIGQVSLVWNTVIADKLYAVGIYKNGSRVANMNNQSALANALTMVCTDIIYCNGTTDYIELYVLSRAGVNTVDVAGNTQGTFLCVHKIG
jgi:hypothetical protein